MSDAHRLVDHLIENIDPKEFVRSRNVRLDHPNPIIIAGSCGKLLVHPDAGFVISYDKEDMTFDDDESCYDDIVEFDLKELRQFIAEHNLTFKVEPGSYWDILDVGFWTNTGDYVPAEAEHRATAWLGAEPQ
jgi:hypothetical protein